MVFMERLRTVLQNSRISCSPALPGAGAEVSAATTAGGQDRKPPPPFTRYLSLQRPGRGKAGEPQQLMS